MMQQINIQNTNDRIPRQRRCSFCRNIGHNISSCYDSRLTHFEHLCNIKKFRLGIMGFRNWLLIYAVENINIVKAYATRYCDCSMRNDINTHINSIIQKICQLDERDEENELLHYSDSDSDSETQTERYVDINVASRIFIDILRHQERNYNKKFYIQTKIVECVNKNMCECGICYDEKIHQEFVKLNCGHEFCKECIKQTLKNVTTITPQCAFCRGEINKIEMSSEKIRDEFNDLLCTNMM